MSTTIASQPVLRQMFGWFDEHARTLWSDHYAKKLRVGNTTLLFLEAILRKRPGLQSIADHLRSVPWMQKWLSVESIEASSLHRKLERLPTELFQTLYHQAIAELDCTYGDSRLARVGPLAAVDSTSVTLGAKRGEWAYVQNGQNAIKVHLSLCLQDEKTVYPLQTVLSTGVVSDNDEEVLQTLVVPSNHTYIFDRGYVDYGRFVAWAEKGIRFVARVRSNNRVRIVRERKCTGSIKRDAVVEVTNPKGDRSAQMRLVEYPYTDKRGKCHQVRVLTNRMELSARDIMRIYAWRWKIELFFRSMKQQLHLGHIYNSSPEAIWNYLYLCLLAGVLCEIMRVLTVPHRTVGYVISLLQIYLEGELKQLLLALHPKRTRTSKGRRKRGGRPRIHPKKLKHQRILVY